ncbi:hypothetical protein PIB30_105740, partial [Stylosanthes scabra]|nr:hypothetical protein [Stylosanthes scabra]
QFPEVRTKELFAEIADSLASFEGFAPNPCSVNVEGASGSRNEREIGVPQFSFPSFDFNLQVEAATGANELGESRSFGSLELQWQQHLIRYPQRPWRECQIPILMSKAAIGFCLGPSMSSQSESLSMESSPRWPPKVWSNYEFHEFARPDGSFEFWQWWSRVIDALKRRPQWRKRANSMAIILWKL